MSRRPLLPSLLVFLMLWGTSFASDPTLILSECAPHPEGLCKEIELVRYEFCKGELTRRVNLQKPRHEDVHFNLGQSRIIDQRYAVSHWGDIFDLEENTLLHIGVGTYLGVEANLVYHWVNNINYPQGVYTYDLSSNRYHLLAAPGKWALPGRLSPDGKKSIVGSPFGDGAATLHTLNGKPKTIATGLEVELDRLASTLSKPPFLWVDNDTVLTQKSNGKLILLDMDGTIHPLVEIPDLKPLISNPKLDPGPDGQVIYRCGGACFEIDIEGRRYDAMQWMPIGDGFEIELYRGKKRGMRIRHQGRVIGEYWCKRSSAATTDGHIAVEHGPVGSNLGYPEGVMVWSAESTQWTEIPIPFIENIIGWQMGPRPNTPTTQAEEDLDVEKIKRLSTDS